MRMKYAVMGAALAALGSTAVLAIPLDQSSSAVVEPHLQSHDLNGIVGKKVLGKNYEFLGYIVAVDHKKATAEMKIPTGASVELSGDVLVDDGDHVTAATISRGDVLAMVQKSGQSNIQEVKVQ